MAEDIGVSEEVLQIELDPASGFSNREEAYRKPTEPHKENAQKPIQGALSNDLKVTAQLFDQKQDLPCLIHSTEHETLYH